MKIKKLLFSRKGEISSFVFLFTILPLMIIVPKIQALAAALPYVIFAQLLKFTNIHLFDYQNWTMGQQLFPFIVLVSIPWVYVQFCLFTKRFNDAGGFHSLIYIILAVEAFHLVKVFLVNFNFTTHLNCGHHFVELMLIVFAAAIGKTGHPFFKSMLSLFDKPPAISFGKPKPIKVPAKYR